MGSLMDAGTLRAGKTPGEGDGEVPRDGEGAIGTPIVIMFRETV